MFSNLVDFQKLPHYVSATYNVLYDKITSDLYYNTNLNQSEINLTETRVEENDKISDYSDYIQYDNYETEENTRLFVDDSLVRKVMNSFADPILIEDNIYLGSAINATCRYVLDTYNIKLIINCAAEISNHFDGEIEYKKYSLYDNNKNTIADALEQIYQTIETFQSTSSGNILVHCMMGRSRSVAVVLYYIMRKKRKTNGNIYTVDEALSFIIAKKPEINPTFRLVKDVIKAIKHNEENNKDKNNDFFIDVNESILNVSNISINQNYTNSSLITSSVIENYEVNDSYLDENPPCSDIEKIYTYDKEIYDNDD